MAEPFIVKARGLPWSATAKEVLQFFHDVSVLHGEDGVHFTFNREGRPTGECFIEVDSKEDMERAIAHDNEHMGKRYIEVKAGNYSEMEWVVHRMSSNQQGSSDGVVRLRGLPFGCSKQDVAQFFEGLQIVPYGITVTMDQDGQPTGDAYVEFATPDDAEKAMGKHKEKIGHRYIEIFKSSKGDIKYVVGGSGGQQDWGQRPLMSQRPGPYDRPSFQGQRARGRGGMNLGPSGFSSSSYGSNYNESMGIGGSMRSPRGSAKAARGGRGSMGGGPGPSNGPGMSRGNVQNSRTGHMVHMRGLPFEATVKDVYDFFSPLNPVDVRMLVESSGRPRGECDVDFASHADCESAMLKDKQNMGHRYIELFLKSSSDGNIGGWSGKSSPEGNGGGGWGGNSGGRAGGIRGGGMGANTNNNYGGGYGKAGGMDSGMDVPMGGGSMGSRGGGFGGFHQGGGGGGYNQNFSENVAYPTMGGGGVNFYNKMR